MKRTSALRVAVPLAVLAMLAAACGGGSDAAPVTDAADVDDCDPEGATISALYADQGDVAANIAKTDMEERFPGLTVELNVSNSSGYDDLTQQAVADFAAGRQHDVLMVGLGQVRFWVDTYHPQPLDPDALLPTYDQKFLDAGSVEGVPYVAPFQVSMPVLYTNTDLQSGAGVEVTPATADELVEAGAAVKENTDASAVSLPRDGIADWVAQAYIQSAGATFVAEDGSVGFDTEEGRTGLEIYEQLGEQELIDPIGFTDAVAQFNRGQLGYLVSTPAQAAAIQAEVGGKFEWTVTDFPVPDGGEPVLPAGGNGWMVLSSEECKAAFAQEMIAAMLAPDIIAESAKTSSYVPVDTEAAATLREDPLVDTQLGYAWTWDGTVTPWGGWHGSATPQVNQILEDMVQQLSNGQSLDEVLPDTVRQINGVAGQ